MSKKSRERANEKRLAQERARQEKQSSPQSPSVPNAEPARWFNLERIVAICAVLSLIVAIVVASIYYGQLKAARDSVTVAQDQLKANDEQLKATQLQLNIALEANDRGAGRIIAKSEVVRVLPTIEELKHLLKPLAPDLVYKDKPAELAEFVHFDDLHTFCKVNPKLHLKNTGSEVIESVRILVKEIEVYPLNEKQPFFHRNPKIPDMVFTKAHKPTLDLIQEEICILSEKFKPGDEAYAPIWKPLIKAMLKAQVMDGKWKGRYFASFEITSYVRAPGTTASDKSEKEGRIMFTWSAPNFTKELCKEKLDDRPIFLTIVRK